MQNKDLAPAPHIVVVHFSKMSMGSRAGDSQPAQGAPAGPTALEPSVQGRPENREYLQSTCERDFRLTRTTELHSRRVSLSSPSVNRIGIKTKDSIASWMQRRNRTQHTKQLSSLPRFRGLGTFIPHERECSKNR